MISFFLFLISSICCVVVAKIIKEKEKIYDIIHDNWPILDLPYLSDLLVAGQLCWVIIAIDSFFLSQMFLICSIFQFLRLICLISTILPALKKYNDKYRFYGLNGNGTEYIFSGHASYSALAAIYLYRCNLIHPFFLLVYNLISQFLIVASRNHYSIDVILAWIIVPLIYGNVVLCLKNENCSVNLTLLL